MDIFHALAEPNRRTILEMLADRGQLSASDIYDNFDVSPPAISQHLKVLREAELVLMKKIAQKRMYELNPEAFSELEAWTKKMKAMWNQKFDRLDQVLKNKK
ncbi:MAG TPA: metalloregulator ArsR/SmtB family transcription factor [Patescibacteria group bacterium]